jgi:ABC-type multidrug transport system ATPase subunit
MLDEPLAGLDEPGIASVMDLLKRLSQKEDITLVIVEHVFNIPRVLQLASTVWTLEEGKLNIGNPAEVQASDRHSRRNGHDWIRKVAPSQSEITRRSLPGGAVLSTVTPPDAADNEVVLETRDLAVRRGHRLVIGEETEKGKVEGISLTLHRGELAVLQAPNGWGKTTLLEAIAGTVPVSQGEIWLNGVASQEIPTWDRDVSLLQAREHVYPTLTVREMLQLAQVGSVPTYVERLLNKQAADLSGGERQKAAMACALENREAELYLLDEPFSALDERSLQRLLDRISELEGASIVALPRTETKNAP